MSDRSAAQRTRRILLLSSLTGDDPEFLRILNEQGTVRTVANVGEALAALRSETFDVVLASASDLPPLARAAVRLQTEPIFETLGHGVCLVDDEGRLVWANQKLSSYPDETVEAVRKACAELYHEFAAEPPQPDHQPRSRQRDLSAGEFAFDLTVSPICGPDGQVARVVALLVDVTATRWLQKRIEAIEAAGRELVRLDADAVAEMDVGERLQLLEDKIARYAHDLLHFDHFSVRLLDKQTCRLDTVVTLGLSEEVNALEIYALKEGNGITGYVAATGRSYLCADVAQDPHYLPGLDNARSSLAVPLLLHDQVIGVLSAESERVKAFSEAYFQLSRRDPTLNQYFSLGQNVLVVVNGQAVQIADEGKEVFTEEELDKLLGRKQAANPLVGGVADVTRTQIASLSTARPIAGLGALLLIVGSALLARRSSRGRGRTS